MEISAVMNIHELAMNRIVKQQADEQARKEQEAESKSRLKKLIVETDDKDRIGPMTITVEQQNDPQAAKLRVERQVDIQAARETIQQAEGRKEAQLERTVSGSVVDIIT